MSNKSQHRGRWIAAALALGLIGVAVALALIYRPDRAIRVGTASVSQLLCEQVFIAGLEPQRVFNEEVLPRRGLKPLLKRLRYRVDPQRQQVVTSWAGHFSSIARYQRGYGCLVNVAAAPSAMPRAHAPSEPTDQPLVPASTSKPALQAALARAFAEPSKPPYRRVRAIVVMHNGNIIAQRYAPGINAATPLLGYSVSKSVMNALVGILVRDGDLQVNARAPVAAWNHADDPRRAITLNQLLRMASGLDLTESESGFDPVSKMLFLHNGDMATFAERASLKVRPGSTWEYTSGNTLIVSSIVRQAVGGTAADVQRFAHKELFGPVGMRHMTMELDAVGTPVGSTRMLASAADWARFGQLYLDDGIVNGKRILPKAWVAYSAKPTLGSDYAAGFWHNAGNTEDAHWRIKNGMPADTFYASGLYGQRIVVVPSQHLVIARFGATIDPPDFDMRGLERLTADVIAAVNTLGQ